MSGANETTRRVSGLLVSLFLLAQVEAAASGHAPFEWFAHQRAGEEVLQSLPATPPIELVLDDGTAEADFGLGGTSRQILWLNQFEGPGGPFLLEAVCVAFPTTPDIEPGALVELLVYLDSDDDPTGGAELAGSHLRELPEMEVDECVSFELSPPHLIEGGQFVLIGVIDRFTVTGMPDPSPVAVLDTTASRQRSWLAVWQDEPPAAPDLTPDFYFDRIDPLIPGNWVIRGFGRRLVTEIPTLDAAFLLALAALLGLAALRLLRRA